jgi:hypothetical protein
MGTSSAEEGTMAATKDQIREAVRKASAGGKLSCEQAHDLGRELGVPLQEIGAVCNELKIKIAACQLGCF